MSREDLFAALRQVVSEQANASPLRTVSDTEGRGIERNAFYSAKEAARLLGFDRAQTMHEIPEAELPRRRVGPRRGKTMFLGRDLMRYALGHPATNEMPWDKAGDMELSEVSSTLPALPRMSKKRSRQEDGPAKGKPRRLV